MFKWELEDEEEELEEEAAAASGFGMNLSSGWNFEEGNIILICVGCDSVINSFEKLSISNSMQT